jgi:hypothetical protein
LCAHILALLVRGVVASLFSTQYRVWPYCAELLVLARYGRAGGGWSTCTLYGHSSSILQQAAHLVLARVFQGLTEYFFLPLFLFEFTLTCCGSKLGTARPVADRTHLHSYVRQLAACIPFNSGSGLSRFYKIFSLTYSGSKSRTARPVGWLGPARSVQSPTEFQQATRSIQARVFEASSRSFYCS